jgi:uncharacterized GH25 family protein
MKVSRMCSLVVIFTMAIIVSVATIASAHDGWVQSNVPRVALGDMVYMDMQFGNHGNTHRDYKIWGSKWDINKASFTLQTPGGAALDMKSKVVDLGFDEMKSLGDGSITYLDKNGYLANSFQAKQCGYYIMDVRQDVRVSYAPERSIKCSKSIVAAVPNPLANYGASLKGFDRILGQVFEVVPLNDPTNLAVGDTLTVQVLYKGAPLADACLSFIPRGKSLPPFGVPNPYDLMTDMDGKASFTFTEANYHLLNVHNETQESGVLDGQAYTQTKYTANLTVIVKPKK